MIVNMVTCLRVYRGSTETHQFEVSDVLALYSVVDQRSSLHNCTKVGRAVQIKGAV